jgi:predicted RNA binding protein YcfA (HicA-like mRNA interferase family)
MKVYKTVELVRIFRKNGFIIKRQTGSHCVLQHYLTGKITIIPVHGGKDLSRGMFKKILKDLDLSLDDFMKML